MLPTIKKDITSYLHFHPTSQEWVFSRNISAEPVASQTEKGFSVHKQQFYDCFPRKEVREDKERRCTCIFQMYVELYDLSFDDENMALWQETARWIKYEEDAEGLD